MSGNSTPGQNLAGFGVRRERMRSIDQLPSPAMLFEKWQALGNDYIVLERDGLPFELTPERVRAICAPHYGCHSDGILLLSRTSDPECVARLRIFNPDGSEAELSGNGVREATMYLHRSGWTEGREMAILTAAGIVRPTVTGERTCSVEMGRARTESADCTDPEAVIEAGGRSWRFQHVNIGNPHAVVHAEREVDRLDLAQVGPAIERATIFPNRTNVEFIDILGAGRVRARIWERGVGETLASGTGASAAAVAATLMGVPSPITVVLDGGELEIEVGEALDVRMTGPAEPVFRGEFSAEFLGSLGGIEGNGSPRAGES